MHGYARFPIEHGEIYGPPIFGLQFSQAMSKFRYTHPVDDSS